MKSVLACGVYLADHPNHVDHLVSRLGSAVRHRLVQRWIAIGDEAVSEEVAGVTVRVVQGPAAKFPLLNELFATYGDLADFDYVLLLDDDILLPDGFVDAFLDLQEELGFALAQPARTPASFISHSIVVQQPGLVGRQTRFVEIGPLLSATREAFALFYPFDLTSPMGWGYEYVWSAILEEHGMAMGIIDCLPVDHTLRPGGVTYNTPRAAEQARAYMALHPHLAPWECYRVLRVFPLEGSTEEDFAALLDVAWMPPPLPRKPRARTFFGRGAAFFRHYGARRFAARLLRPWLWLRGSGARAGSEAGD